MIGPHAIHRDTCDRLACTTRLRRLLLAGTAFVAFGVCRHGTEAMAANPPGACRLLSTVEVGSAAHRGHVRSRAVVQRGYGVTGVEVVFSLCDYSAGVDPVAELQLLQLQSTKDAGREFSRDVTLSAGNGLPRRTVHGPWTAAYQFGTEEIWILKGDWIMHFYFVENARHSLRFREGLVRTMALTAVGRLPS
jgi:hypothetical protein